MNLVRVMLFCCIGTLLSMEVAVADHQVFLVVASNSPLQELDSLELRKIYLGFTVKRDGQIIKGLRNTKDKNLNRIFLQTVVAMSEKSYNERLLFLTLRHGIPRPAEYDETESLLNALSANPYSVSYMLDDDATQSPKVRILKVLWQQN